MFRLTWNCFNQNKETGEIEPLIHTDRNTSADASRLNIAGTGNRPDVPLPVPERRSNDISGAVSRDFSIGRGSSPTLKKCRVRYWMEAPSKPKYSAGNTTDGVPLPEQCRQTGTGGPMPQHMPQHMPLFIRTSGIISAWSPSLQKLVHTIFSNEGLRQIEESKLLGACTDLLARLDVLPSSCQLFLAMEVSRNSIRLTLDDQHKLYYFLIDLLNDGSYSCPTCHYLADMLDTLRNLIVSQ